MGAANTYDATLTAITATEQLNLIAGTCVYSVPDALKQLMPLARWIPTSNDFEMDLLNPAQTATAGSATAATRAFIVLNFEGCTPSTQIGQIYVSSCMSFKPASSLGGLY